MKTRVKIAIAAGGVLVSALAAAPAQAFAAATAIPAASVKAAVPEVSGNCDETFACVYDQRDDLEWSTNAVNTSAGFPFNNGQVNVSYAENRTGYWLCLDAFQGSGYGWEGLPPHTSLTKIEANVSTASLTSTPAQECSEDPV